MSEPSDAGALIVLEGIDGAGTTTQAALLATALSARGHRVHLTRQPSNGPVGQVIRATLRGDHHMPDGSDVDERVMALLFAADRADHAQREVLPELDAGSLVICSRWTTSALAYQAAQLVHGGAIDAFPHALQSHLAWVEGLASADAPDLIIWLRCRPETAHQRRRSAGLSPDRYDDLAFQHTLAESYERIMASGGPDGTAIEIDGEPGISEVHERVLSAVTERIRR